VTETGHGFKWDVVPHPRDTVYLLIEAEILRRERGESNPATIDERIYLAAHLVQELAKT